MNEEMKYMAQELEEFLRKGHRLLDRIKGQSMGQRRGYGPRSGYGNREDIGPWGNDSDMGERSWYGSISSYDPRFM